MLNEQKTYQPEYRDIIAGFIMNERDPWGVGNHTIHYFSVDREKNASLGLTCACGSPNPVAIRKEIDHNSNVYYNAFCVDCMPKVVKEVIENAKK